MDLMTGIAAATKALEALKAIREIDKSFDAATWKAKVAELMGSVADMKMALLTANDAIRALENDKKELTSKLIFKAEKTTYENGFLYEVFEGGNVAEFPFCQRCLTEAKYIRLARSGSGGGAAVCPGCKAIFELRSVMHRG